MIRPHERATLETGVLKMWDLEAEWRANPTGIPRRIGLSFNKGNRDRVALLRRDLANQVTGYDVGYFTPFASNLRHRLARPIMLFRDRKGFGSQLVEGRPIRIKYRNRNVPVVGLIENRVYKDLVL
jgi:hypothetical protein